MVIINYSPKNTKFLSRSFLESLYIFPSFIFGISQTDFNKIGDIFSFFRNLIISFYNNKYNLNNNIIFEGIRLNYITDTIPSVNHIITNKLRYNITIFPGNNVFNESFNININTFILSDFFNSSITNKINPFKSIVVINTNYGNNNNYDIISIYIIIFKHTSTSEKSIFSIKNLDMYYLDVR